jgi:hypothetical protein
MLWFDWRPVETTYVRFWHYADIPTVGVNSSQGKKTGWNGGRVPPGWSKGKKVGWGNIRNSPPGWR